MHSRLTSAARVLVHHALFACALCLPSAPVWAAGEWFYIQDFEAPTGFVNSGGDVDVSHTVQQLFGSSPTPQAFAQSGTVGTLLLTGNEAWGRGYDDINGMGGQHALGFSSGTGTRLALPVDIGSWRYLVVAVSLSPADLDRWGGPYVPGPGVEPLFRFSVYDNPDGASRLGSGTPLSWGGAYVSPSREPWTIDFTNLFMVLDAQAATNGKLLLELDLMEGGYGVLDNMMIAGYDGQGDLPPIPEPETYALMLAGLMTVGSVLVARRRQR